MKFKEGVIIIYNTSYRDELDYMFIYSASEDRTEYNHYIYYHIINSYGIHQSGVGEWFDANGLLITDVFCVD